MSQVRRMERLLKGSIAEQHNRAWQQGCNDPRRECEPTFNLDEQIAQARADMGPGRWAELNLEWETPFIAERIVDLSDAEQFPELALAREHARRLREKEARHG